MALTACPRGADFSVGILIQKKMMFLFDDNRLPTGKEIEAVIAPLLQSGTVNYYGDSVSGTFAAELPDTAEDPPYLKKILMRDFFVSGDSENGRLVARASMLLNWHKTTRFCTACGHPLRLHGTETAKECIECKHIFFPVIAPCIIVAVHRDDRILLARHVHRNKTMYTCLSGFIEAGESAEAAVVREIKEETGLTVKNITYRGSQGWPYPNELMLGYTAEYDSGELVLQKEEIADAQWFSRACLPQIPKPGSLAYDLITGEHLVI